MNDIAITRAEVVTLQPGDLLVFRFDGHLTQQEHERLGDDLHKLHKQAGWPDSVKWIICDASMDVEVMRAGTE